MGGLDRITSSSRSRLAQQGRLHGALSQESPAIPVVRRRLFTEEGEE
jgi:hypothetical protein